MTNAVVQVSKLTEAISRAGFRVGPDLLGVPTLWCDECGRDSGYHHDKCSKSTTVVNHGLMLSNLTATQTRCTQLLNELRAFKASAGLPVLSAGLPGLGWDCPSCGAFNGDLKEKLTTCRCCTTPRPT